MISEEWSEIQKVVVSKYSTIHTCISNYLFKIITIMSNSWGLKKGQN